MYISGLMILLFLQISVYYFMEPFRSGIKTDRFLVFIFALILSLFSWLVLIPIIYRILFHNKQQLNAFCNYIIEKINDIERE